MQAKTNTNASKITKKGYANKHGVTNNEIFLAAYADGAATLAGRAGASCSAIGFASARQSQLEH